MKDDLTARLRAAETSVEQQLRGEDNELGLVSVLSAEVRRRRARRSVTTTVGVAAAAVLLVAVPVLALQQPATPPPASPPTVSPVPEVTTPPPPSPDPSPTGPVAPPPESSPPLEPVTVEGAPTMYRMPDGLLEDAGPGWVLLQYQAYAVYSDDGTTELEPSKTIVVVADPAGTRYLVTEDAPYNIRVVDWRAGELTAVIELADPSQRAILDLRTGDIRAEPAGLTDVHEFAGRRADGAELWWIFGPEPAMFRLVALTGTGVEDVAEWPSEDSAIQGAILDGDGRTMVTSLWGDYFDDRGGTSRDTVRLVQLDDGTVTDVLAGPEGWACSPLGWRDRTTLLTACIDDPVTGGAEPGRQVVVAVDTEGGSAPQVIAEPTEAEAVPIYHGVTTDAGVVLAVTAPSENGPRIELWVWRGSEMTPLWQPEVPVDPRSLVSVEPGGEDRVLVALGPVPTFLGGSEVWSVDTNTGAAVLLGPVGSGERPVDAVDWVAAR